MREARWAKPHMDLCVVFVGSELVHRSKSPTLNKFKISTWVKHLDIVGLKVSPL